MLPGQENNSVNAGKIHGLIWAIILIFIGSCQTTEYIPDNQSPDRFYTYAGFPEVTNYPNPLILLYNKGYVSGYDETRGVPAWVAYRVFRVDKYLTSPRPRRFLIDERTGNRITHNHYTNSGYDRGHMAPNFAVITRYGKEAQRETFYMTNIIPQAPYLNRQWWVRLERLVARNYSEMFDQVWVIAGPVFQEKGNWIRNTVKVPSHNFMIIKVINENELRMKAFLVPQNVQGDEALEAYLVSVNEIEELTGLDFNPALETSAADSLESLRHLQLWEN